MMNDLCAMSFFILFLSFQNFPSLGTCCRCAGLAFNIFEVCLLGGFLLAGYPVSCLVRNKKIYVMKLWVVVFTLSR